jgi:aminocarboxymuconate-semialdehyde decarboxylase
VKIDIFPHIYPKRFAERILSDSGPAIEMAVRFRQIPVLTDLELRFRIMDLYGDYVQVLTLSSPPIEVLGTAKQTPELARMANDGMAELVEKYPARFPGFVASIAMNNPDAVNEIERAITELGATGIQIFSNVNGRPSMSLSSTAVARWRHWICRSGCTRRAVPI